MVSLCRSGHFFWGHFSEVCGLNSAYPSLICLVFPPRNSTSHVLTHSPGLRIMSVFCSQSLSSALISATLALRCTVLAMATCTGRQRTGAALLAGSDRRGLCDYGRKEKSKEFKIFTVLADSRNKVKEEPVSFLGIQFNNCLLKSHCTVSRRCSLYSKKSNSVLEVR